MTHLVLRPFRTRCAQALVILSLFAGLVWVAAAVTAPVQAGASASATAQSGHAPFGSCSASDIEMLVSIPHATYARGKDVNVTALIRNVGQTACTFERLGPEPAPGSALSNEPVGMGPCGAMPIVVRNKKGTAVWPGTVFCPLLSSGGPGLEPGAQLIAKGSWNQEIQPGLGGKTSFHGSVGPAETRAPRGSYSVVVDKQFTFHIRLR
jgi:hypothetical protein